MLRKAWAGLTSRRSGRASVASLCERAMISAMSSVSRHSARISATHRRGRRAASLSGSRAPLDSSVRPRMHCLEVQIYETVSGG